MAKGKVTFYWALDKDLDRISIKDADSGANGYYCEGCKNEMEACKGQEVRPYFRHHSKLAPNVSKDCPWNNELARHAIGKDILQMEKEIKVPSLYIKVPPEYRDKRNEVEFTKIRGSYLVQAHEVLKEKYVYENEFGEVKYASGENKEIEKKYLYVKPDVIFLDKERKIILMVELHATHKVDHEKQAKLFRLGIDAVEVKIPKTHESSEIGNNFKITKNTKWLYNHEQATTKFNPNKHLAGKRSKGAIVDGGDFLPGETYECRAFRINEAIRSIKGLLGGTEFNERRNAIEGELLRIERAKDGFRQKLSDRNSRAETEARTILARLEKLELQQIDSLTKQEEEITGEENREQEAYRKRYSGLEQRYIDKKGEIEREEGTVADSENESGEGLQAVRDRLEREESDLRGEFEPGITELTGTIQQSLLAVNSIEKRGTGLADREQKIRLATDRAQLDLDAERGNFETERGAYQETCEKLGRIRNIRKEFSNIQDQALQKRPNKRN